jgi:predicted alpha/beta superfamily hydrolase
MWLRVQGIFFLLFFTFLSCEPPVLQETEFGTIERIENFSSRYVTARNIDIWLPEGYPKDAPYGVLYMHDGQNLYDSTTTWNQQAWEVDRIAQNLINQNKVKPFIVVGPWNGNETRHADYFPQAPYESISPAHMERYIKESGEKSGELQGFQPNSDNYLKFLVEELLPIVEEKYRVSQKQEKTYVAGSSMGGLISMYALCEYPEVFGGAACLSTHWPGGFSLPFNPVPKAFKNYLRTHLPNPGTHKIYFDHGDQTLDSLYPDLQKEIDKVMIAGGWDSTNWMTKTFPGQAHTEDAWKSRLHIPLEFLLAKE